MRISRSRKIHRGKARRSELAAIAEAIFLKRGFHQTTMQDIACEAGASKETLYHHFHSKEEMFLELVHVRAVKIFDVIDPAFGSNASPVDQLNRMGVALLRIVPQEPFRFCRALAARAIQSPAPGRHFVEQCLNQLIRSVAVFLDAESTAFDCPDSALAAKIFVGALMTCASIESLLLESRDVNEDEIKKFVAEVVTMFMASYGRIDNKTDKTHLNQGHESTATPIR